MKNDIEHNGQGILDRFSNPGKIQLIYSKHLHSGLPYQRPVRQAHVNRLIRKWDPKNLTPTEVGYRDDKYNVVNGQHRLAAMRRMNSGEDLVNVVFKYLISEFYSRDLSQKYTSAKYVKFRRGEYQSRICPYGYRKSADGRMEPDPETAENVKFLFDMAATGRSTTDIIKALFDRRVPTPGEYKASRGQCYHDISRAHGIWQRSTILNILHDERYTGTYIIGKRRRVEIGSNHVRMKDESEWIKIPDHHPAIISKELFSQVQTAIGHVKSEKKKVAQYPLKGEVFCGYCFHRMQRIGKKAYRFACTHSQVNESAPCHGLAISEQDLDNLLFDILSKQAQAIINLPDLSHAGRVDVELAKQTEYGKQIEGYLDQKRLLYERFLLK